VNDCQLKRAGIALVIASGLALAACGGDAGGPRGDGTPADVASPRVIAFNTGTPECSRAPDAEYTCDDADTAGEWYGTGLAHLALMADVRAFFDGIDADIVGIQEIFHAPNCTEIPAEHHAGFICEEWAPGDATVATRILGPEYQVACHRGRPDKCLAVRRAFGQIRRCNNAFCADLLDGGMTDDCGGGTRIGRAVIDLAQR